MDMEPKGFLHHKVDVKVLILFILARIDAPLTGEEIYEVAYQDDSLNYFVFAESLPELVDSGHLNVDELHRYTITDMGRQQGACVEDSLAVPVVQKVSAAIAAKQAQLRNDSYITTQVTQDQAGNWIVTLRYQVDTMPMLGLSLMAPNAELGEAMAQNLKKHANELYKFNMETAIESRKKRSADH
jgi:hypothetical protein